MSVEHLCLQRPQEWYLIILIIISFWFFLFLSERTDPGGHLCTVSIAHAEPDEGSFSGSSRSFSSGTAGSSILISQLLCRLVDKDYWNVDQWSALNPLIKLHEDKNKQTTEN